LYRVVLYTYQFTTGVLKIGLFDVSTVVGLCAK